MKKTLSILLVIVFMLSAVACAKNEEPAGTIDFGSDPSASVQPGDPTDTQSGTTPGGSTASNAPGSTAPGAPASPGASVSPGTSVSPSASASPGASTSPTPGGAAAPKSYSEAKAINSDVIGWIKVPGTNIDYPVLYDDPSDGVWFYNNHDIYKKSTGNPGAGSIYTYYDVLTRNVIVTGHNMRQSGTMLHELHKLQDNKSSLKTKANRTFSIRLFGFTKWEVFALYETKDSEPSSTIKYNIKHLSSSDNSNKKEIEDWIAKQKSRSEIDLGVSVSADDFLMTIITCGDNYDYSEAQSRLYYFLRAVE